MSDLTESLRYIVKPNLSHMINRYQKSKKSNHDSIDSSFTNTSSVCAMPIEKIKDCVIVKETKSQVTRMHSSRMRTVLSSSRICSWRGGVPGPGGWYLVPGGCTCLGGVPAWGVYLPGGVPARGVYLPRGYLPRYSPPPVNRMTDRQV